MQPINLSLAALPGKGYLEALHIAHTHPISEPLLGALALGETQLCPQNRGILATIYLEGDAAACHRALAARYADEPFMVVLPLGEAPATRHVRGSNFCHVGVVADRRPGRVIVFSALDNLVKGASGQAVQNANLMLGIDETAGLMAAPLFP